MDILSSFGTILDQNIFLGITLAFIAGIVASFTPCSLSTLPLIIGYVTVEGKNTSTKKGFLYSIFFSIGTVLTFTLLGVFSVAIGLRFKILGSLWYYILAVILIFVTLQLFGVIKFKDGNYCHKPKLKKGIFGAFFLGILGGIFTSPCSTPALVAILTYVSSQGNMLFGAILMAAYSIGHCIIILIAGTSLEAINKLALNDKYEKIGQILKIIFGIITLIMALYMLYIAF